MTKFNKAIALTVLIASAGIATQASAMSFRVKMACASDYYSYCSKHKPGSAGVKSCMRANGGKLSARCVNALIGAGYVSKKYVERRRASR